jgi:hypothetical protein
MERHLIARMSHLFFPPANARLRRASSLPPPSRCRAKTNGVLAPINYAHIRSIGILWGSYAQGQYKISAAELM